MSTNLYRKVGEMDYDGLLADITPPVQVRGGTIDRLETAAILARGTVMAKGATTGKLFVLGTAETYQKSQKFSGDGTTDDFTVTDKPATFTKVTIGGTATTAYTYVASTGVITFTSAPASGTNNVEAFYNMTDTGTADCILCDNTEVGTTADVNAAVYTAGCFDPNKVTVAESYTLTEADMKQLREYDIVFKAASAAN